MPAADAQAVAALMVDADQFGYDTHGVFRLRQYVNRLRGGGINPTATLAVVRETAATALVDGDNGLGHLAMRRAGELGDTDAFVTAVDLAFDMRASAPLPGHEPVRIPGEARGATWGEREAAGLPIHAALLAELGRIAAELDVPGPAVS